MAGGGRDSGMKQQDKLGFQNGARNALKMFEIVIDICMYTYTYIVQYLTVTRQRYYMRSIVWAKTI